MTRARVRAVLRWLIPLDAQSWTAYVHPTYRFRMWTPQRLLLIDLAWVLIGVASLFLNIVSDRLDFLTVWILCLLLGWAAGMARSRRALAYFVGWQDGRAMFANDLLKEIDERGPMVTKSGRLLTDADIRRLANEDQEHADDDG